MIQIERISKYVPHGREFSKIHPSTSNLMKDYEGTKIREKKVSSHIFFELLFKNFGFITVLI